MKHDHAHLFRLIVKLSGGTAIIDAWEGPWQSPNHTRIDCRLRWKAKGTGRNGRSVTIFERGDTWCGIPGHQTIDGKAARECVMSTLAMKPGDTDSDYFDGYTEKQLGFVVAHGEELSLEASCRYGEP